MRKSKVAGYNPSCDIATVSGAAKEKWKLPSVRVFPGTAKKKIQAESVGYPRVH
jgi:hypothetical protein